LRSLNYVIFIQSTIIRPIGVQLTDTRLKIRSFPKLLEYDLRSACKNSGLKLLNFNAENEGFSMRDPRFYGINTDETDSP